MNTVGSTDARESRRQEARWNWANVIICLACAASAIAVLAVDHAFDSLQDWLLLVSAAMFLVMTAISWKGVRANWTRAESEAVQARTLAWVYGPPLALGVLVVAGWVVFSILAWLGSLPSWTSVTLVLLGAVFLGQWIGGRVRTKRDREELRGRYQRSWESLSLAGRVELLFATRALRLRHADQWVERSNEESNDQVRNISREFATGRYLDIISSCPQYAGYSASRLDDAWQEELALHLSDDSEDDEEVETELEFLFHERTDLAAEMLRAMDRNARAMSERARAV